MSNEEDSKKSRGSYTVLVGLLLLVLILLFMVPFASVGLAIKKYALLGQKAALDSSREDSTAQKLGTSKKQIPDLAGLRNTLEKAASNAIALPKLESTEKGFQIEVQPPATIETASLKVLEVLSKNHYQFVEAYDKDRIKIIVLLKSSEWPELTKMLGEATDLYGFIYRGPSTTKTTTNSCDSTVAEIEILRKR